MGNKPPKAKEAKKPYIVGFVFTNYNNSYYTEQAIISISKLEDHQWRKIVIIVDNNSTSSSKDQLREIQGKYNFVDVIFNSENVGYFSGLNIGISRLREMSKDITCAIIGNNDLTFPPDFLSKIFNNIDTISKMPVIAPDIITLNGVHQNPHVLHKISKIREFIWDIFYSNYNLSLLIKWLALITKKATERSDYKHYQAAGLIEQGYGACFILSPLFFQKYNYLWSPTFLMGEEFFLNLQLRMLGYKYYYLPTITVFHYDHATFKSLHSRKIWRISKDSHQVYRKYVVWPRYQINAKRAYIDILKNEVFRTDN